MKAAWQSYLQGQLLLGSVSYKTSKFSFFPRRLRESWSWVVISNEANQDKKQDYK